MFFVAAYSLAVDLTAGFLPPEGLSDDLLLNALYGGVGMGIGVALVYRGQGTSGGSDILSRILATRRGIPISQTYLMTDAFTMLMAGLTFGWEKALYAIVFIYISGLAAETIVQGAPVVRTAMIVTGKPADVSERILRELGRGGHRSARQGDVHRGRTHYAVLRGGTGGGGAAEGAGGGGRPGGVYGHRPRL